MNIGRTRFRKDIVTEFVPPANRKSRKVMIFCSGVPGVPHKDEVLDFWAKKGWWTFFPRYRGTWESGGEFLADSPEKDVLDVLSGLKNRFTDYWSNRSFQVKPESVTVVGSSFGGPAAILASRDRRINKAICISPVVDWKAEDRHDPLDDLYLLLRHAYGAAYRVSKRNWNKLKRGRFYNPVKHIPEIDGNKILVFHAKDDEVVRYHPVARFTGKTGCKMITLAKGGHLSSSMLMSKRYFTRVRKFMQAS